MGRFADRAAQCLAMLARVTGLKKGDLKHMIEVEPATKHITEGVIEIDTKWEIEGGAKNDCCKGCRGEAPGRTTPKKGGVYHPNAEFPWRLEQVVEREENWRGTWVLEVKDMRAMDWGTPCVPKADGRGGKYQRQPTRHLLFSVDGDGHREALPGGQDDLMVQLGRRRDGDEMIFGAST